MGDSMSTDQPATKPLTLTDDVKRGTAQIAHTDPELGKILQSFGDKIAARAENEPAETKLPAKIIQLPFWPDPVRGGPNPVLRSALFAAIHSKKRQRLGTQTSPDKEPKGITIAAQDGIIIKYAGTQLNQYDADVFFEALHRARLHPLETECLFTGYSFLKAIGRTPNNLNYEDLDNSLTRLRDGRVEIHYKMNGCARKFVGGLISFYEREDNTKLYKVSFAKRIRELFAPACWTQLEWEERMALKGHPIAQWLHSFYSSHVPKPFPLSASYLHPKTGSNRPLLKHFRQDLKHALVTLEKVLGWKATWEGDLLTLSRPPSPSQARHLRHAKPATKKLAKP
jgi:TrfA protein